MTVVARAPRPRPTSGADPGAVPRGVRDGGAVRVALLLLIVAAALQSPLAALLPGRSWTTVLDDLALAVLVAAVAPRLGRLPVALGLGVAAWWAAVGFAASASDLGAGPTLVVARQVAVPVALVLVGACLGREEWSLARRATIVVGVVDALYALLELGGVHLLDATALATFNADHIVLREGLPAYYWYWFGPSSPLSLLGHDHVLRTGGTLLNPPVAGLVAATSLVFAWHEAPFRGRRVVLLLLAVATATSLARGGFLVAGAGIALASLGARVGRLGTVAVCAPLLWFAATQLSDDGDSASHSDGLRYGLVRALTTVTGEGFGHAGNLAKSLGLAEASESLAGIAFAAAGLPALVLVTTAALVCCRAVTGPGARWEHGLAVGAMVASLFSESAGALNGTVALWLAVGVALVRRPTVDGPPTVQRRTRP